MTTANQTLEQITIAEQDAMDSAAKAQAAAETAKARADAARLRAEQERERANRAYLDLVAEEWPEARQQAVSTVADAYQELDQAVRNGGDVFAAYRGWVGASIKAWELDEALARMRRFFGLPTRDVATPVFSFNLDVGAIIDMIGLELQDEAVQRIDQRRASYLAGRKES